MLISINCIDDTFSHGALSTQFERMRRARLHVWGLL